MYETFVDDSPQGVETLPVPWNPHQEKAANSVLR